LVGGVGDISDLASAGVPGLDVFALSGYIFFSLGVVDDLSFNGEVLYSFPCSLDWFVLDDRLFDLFRDVFDLGFDGVVVGDGFLDGDSLSVDYLFVLDNLLFVGDLDYFLHSVILDVLLFEGDVLDAALNGDLLRCHSGAHSARHCLGVVDGGGALLVYIGGGCWGDIGGGGCGGGSWVGRWGTLIGLICSASWGDVRWGTITLLNIGSWGWLT
jgi:hypothetical protein